MVADKPTTMNHRITLVCILASAIMASCAEKKAATATSSTAYVQGRSSAEMRKPANDANKDNPGGSTTNTTRSTRTEKNKAPNAPNSTAKPVQDGEKTPAPSGNGINTTKPIQEGTRGPQTTSGSVQFGGPNRADSLFFSMERTPCFGTCKAYRINVYRSGFATFEGRANVAKEGLHSGHIGPDSLAQLMSDADRLGFWDLQERYDNNATDLPSSIIRIVGNGKDKKVVARTGTPATFTALFSKAEEMLFPVPWKPVPKAE